MSAALTYLITGANRGIGLGLAATLLQRPGTTVIATVRDQITTDCSNLKKLPLAPGSVLYVESLAVADETSLVALRETLIHKHDIKSINIIIANAGTGTQFNSCAETSTSSLLENFTINTIGPILLYQTLRPLLLASSAPKFIVISSILGSISAIGEADSPALAYGISKTGTNFFVRKLHFEVKELVTLSVHPGWVKTGNGQAFADAVGVEAPPLTVEQSVGGLLKQIEVAEKETTSGTFVSYDGTAIGY